MGFIYTLTLAALLSGNSLCVMAKEIVGVGDINIKQIEQDYGVSDSDGSSDTDKVKQLQSLQATISKLESIQETMSAQMSLMQRNQRDSEQKDKHITNQLNDLADENQKLRHLLVKLMTAKNQSRDEVKDLTILDFRREFNQYMEETGGVTYVRWGRTTCEDPAYPLYTGYAASGAAYGTAETKGGSTDIVCLHPQPQFANILTGGYSKLFGLEYNFYNLPFSTVNNGGANLAYNDMPCTVCHISSRSHQFMLPGRNTCPSGWVLEYLGYLVSSQTHQQKMSMICLDEAPESIPGGAAHAQGAYVSPIEGTCTAIHCPPYRADYELTCAVCSK